MNFEIFEEEISNFESKKIKELLENIYPVMANFKLNQELFKNLPHFHFGDIGVYFIYNKNIKEFLSNKNDILKKKS